MSLIELAINHRLGGFSIDLAFESDGKLTALFGRSGAGKTTVVNLIGGLLRPQSGRVVIAGDVLLDTQRRIFVPTHRRRIGYVFQEARLFPHLSVRHNLTYGRWFAGDRSGAITFDDVVGLLGLERLVDRRPAGLSGGERQRVAIGRALLANPRLLLLDEPFASLDEERKAAILPYVERLRDEVGVPMIYVSHSISEVARLASTVVLIADGRLRGVGSPGALLGRSDLLPLTGGDAAISMLEAQVESHDTVFGLTTLTTSAGTLTVPQTTASPGHSVRVVIRASDVMLARQHVSGISALNILHGRIAELTEEGSRIVDVGLDCGGQRLLARITRRSAHAMGLAVGQELFAIIKTVALDDRDRLGQLDDPR